MPTRFTNGGWVDLLFIAPTPFSGVVPVEMFGRTAVGLIAVEKKNTAGSVGSTDYAVRVVRNRPRDHGDRDGAARPKY